MILTVDKGVIMVVIKRKNNITKAKHLHIIHLLGFHLHSTCFLFQGNYYEQVDGAAMGYPVRPIAGNIHIELFEEVTVRTVETQPRLWRRYVVDTFVIQHTEHKENFLHHISTID